MEHATQELATDDGVRISVDCYREPGRDTALIICPGFFQSKDTLTFQRLARALAGLCDVICLDFRGHGRSGGLYTFSALEEADLSAAARWATKRYRRIGILGFSLGGATAINFVSRHRQITSLIAVSAPAKFDEIEFEFWTTRAIRTGLRGFETGSGCRPGNLWRTKRPAIEAIADIAPVPVLLIHGTEDPIVGLRHGEALFERAREPKRLHVVQGGGHAEHLFRSSPESFLQVVRDWLMETLIEPLGRTPAWSDGFLTIRGGLSIYYQRHGTGADRPSLVIVHGGGEHVGRYADAVRRFLDEGFIVYLFDLPGHGRSSGKRGHVRRFDDYLRCLEGIVSLALRDHPAARPVVLGHSLGGLIATCYAVKFPDKLRGLILSSPLWGLTLPVPAWKRVVAHGLARIWPSFTMQRTRTPEFALSHDPDVKARYLADPLVHRVASAGLYLYVRRLFRRLPHLVRDLRVPVLVLQAGDDRIASAQATAALFPRIASEKKTLRIYDGYYHELLNEVGRDAVFQEIVTWLRWLGTSTTGPLRIAARNRSSPASSRSMPS